MDRNILLVCLAITALVNAQNECSDTVHKPLGDLAKRSPTYFQDGVPLCDRYLAQGWYVAFRYDMPTTAPGLWECGTTYPVWLNDTLPETQGSKKLAKVCEVDFVGSCSRSHLIWITNCGNFFVYELIPLDRCSSAYCFKQDESCVYDVPSNISVAYHSVTWNTREEGITSFHDPDVNLVCKFDRLPDQSFYYDVTWYVDNTEVLTNQTVSSNSSDLALLTGSHLFANEKKANSMIHCIVGAKISKTGIPCITAGSSLFFAGIKVLNSTLRIPRGGRQDVMLQFTIPFINQNIVRQGTSSTVQNPLYISLGVHGGSIACEDKNKKACDYTVSAYEKQETYRYETDDWKVIHRIPIYNKDNGVYEVNDKHITLRLETGFTESPGSKIFQYLTLPDIQVYIEDTDSAWKGAMCASHTDPHMMTFDKKTYECQLDGTYVLYRNKRFQQEVQERHHMCHPDYSYPRCSCAVAVRSGKDVFIVDICNIKPIIDFPSCGDGVLKVIKINDKYFKVTLPTGTLVEIKFVQWPYNDDWQLNVEIFPSPSDVGTTSGLCGILDGDYKNDFTRSDDTVDSPHLTYPDDFSESWRVKDNQLNLFDHHHYNNLVSISEVLDYVCTCKTEYENRRLVKKSIECNYGTYQNCNFVVGKRYFCIINPEGQLRRKRDVRHLESMFSNSENEIEIDFVGRRQKRETVQYIKTYEEAEATCNTAFESSTSYRICREYVTDLSNTSLVNCISDVMMTGDNNFTRIHIEAALEQCSVFVVFNTTFQQTEPDITYTIETFCQNNCSGHGICNAGNCTCENGYAGSDCSFDLLGPPTISHISDFGFCDKSKEACDEITLFGKYFTENMNTNCFMRRHTLREDGTSVSVVDYVVGLEERTLFEGFCPLDYDTTNHWVTEFSFNVSNDGSRFTENFQVYTYQSLCQEYQNDTGNITFVFKDGYCFINNSCVADGSTNTNNKCDICNTSRSTHEWSYNEGHCLISGVCYKSGEINGTNPCSICDPTVDKTDWSPSTDFCFIDGICYSNSQTQLQKDCLVCQPNSSRTEWTLKDDHCLINELCFMNGQSNDSNPCQLCNTSQSNDFWTENSDLCFIHGSCYSASQTKVGKECLVCQPNSTRTNWTLKNDHCLINELCFMDRHSNESNPCQMCNTSRSKETWTENPDFCFIDGTCYKDSQTQVGKDCLVCQPISTRTNWTMKHDFCLINELCFMNTQFNESNPCQLCDTSQSKDSWTENLNFCFINGTCYSEGQTQVGKDCLVCQPNSTRTNWTLKHDHCLINDLCFMNSQSNQSNMCQLCNTSKGKYSWTENPDFCSIDGTCYNESQTQVGKDCLVCKPNSTRTNWTMKHDHCLITELCFMNSQFNESNPCQLCNISQSKDSWTENPDFCFINGTCYSEGQTKVGKDCLVCQPNSTRADWTLKHDHCLINELCFMNSQSNQSNPCQLCDTSKSKDSWTENPDFCFIINKCYKASQTHGGKDCLVCQANTTRTNWTLKNDHCLINELCFMDTQYNDSNPCQLCNTSQSKDSWTENPDFCSIENACYSESQTQVGKDCLVCQPNSTRTNWTLKNDFCFINNACYIDGQTQIGKDCFVCQPDSSITSWTLKNDHCLINELCFMNSQSNESNPCQVCNTLHSNESWTENPDFCSINDRCYSDGQTHLWKECLVCQPNSTRTNWTLKHDYCLINELCFMNNQTNESNPCQLCNTSQRKDSLTENPDFCIINGTCYSDGQTLVEKECLSCHPNLTRANWTLKNDYCLINELCFMNNQINESNPCQLCNSSQSKDSWSENTDFCSINGTCYSDSQTEVGKDCLVCQPNSTRNNWTLKNDRCLINELCFMDSQSNDSNPCQLCNTSQSKDSWTENPDFCFINGTCYRDGQTKIGKDCLVCQPNLSRTNWTLKNDHCLINELCFMNGKSNESNPCQLCKTSQNKDSWTENPDFCSIDGTCYSDGQTNVGKDCLFCHPNSTRTNWTLKKDHCLINELCFMDSKSNETNPCQLCNTSQSKDSWTENTDSCIINGTCFSNGQTQLGNDCLVCQPNTTRNTWTLKNDHCLINELCFLDSQSNESNPCQLCNTSQSKDSWTENPDFCSINGECYSDGQTQVGKGCLVCHPNSKRTNWTLKYDHCFITELCFLNNQSNESNPCQLCNSSQSRDAWTENPDFCSINGTCYSDGQTQVGKDCLVCQPNSTRTDWTLKQDHCLINEMCYMDSHSNKSNPCQICKTSQSKDSWTENPDCFSTISIEPSTETTPEPDTATLEPTTTIPETTTTTLEPKTTTLEPTTTTQEPTTTTPEPTTTTSEPTTPTPEPATTTPESTTTTPEPTTTTPEPTTTTPEPTTTIPEPTTTTPEPSTTTSSTATTTPEPTTTTTVILTSVQPCRKSPEDVSVVYHNVSWISTNETNGTIIRTVHEPYINFKCMFVLLQDLSLFYKIEWYVNNATLVKTLTVSAADIDQTTLSSKDMPPLNKAAGIQIQCTVSVSKDPVSENCESKASPVFFAGIKVSETKHNLLRKGKTAILMYLTVPYVTKTEVLNGQSQPLPTLAIYALLPPSTSRCRGSIGVDKCVIEFKAFSSNEKHKYDSNDWTQNQTLVLYHVDTNGYEIDQSLTVQLKTRSTGNMFWNNFNQNISMTITDYNEHWKGKSCGSKTDPHMYTFDGVSYENHINGEFILYRNKLFNQEVQTRHKQCHPDYNFPHCTCAVSVQSGQDVFLVDLCEDIQFVDFLRCNDSVIQVYKISDKLYKISLPTGTYVMVSLVEWPVQGSWQIDIDIYPSLSDGNNTEGLCGTLDGDRDNDFTRRSGDTDTVSLTYPDDFSNSWKVLSDENLLKEPLSKRQPVSSNLDKVCLCSPNDDQCSYSMHCSTTVEKKFLCTEPTFQASVSRKKRELSQKWIHPSLSVATSLTRKRRNVQFNISTTRENAETVCTTAFESSDSYKTCHQYVNDLSNSSLSNCINDVIMTGDNNITSIHVEAALQQCVTFVGLNSTLQNANPSVTTSLKKLCPSNCSGHGMCKEGNCSCEVGFGGSDCSFDILSPPIIWDSTPSGTCDKTLHQCSRVYLKGRYFLENVDKICYVTKQFISQDGSVLAFTQQDSSLEEENLFRGSCFIPSDDVTSWVTKYIINVSYDRKQFTQSFSFYTYQSECQQHSLENGLDLFTLKKEYCFINNTCVQRAATSSENRCQVCDPDRNNYQWSGKQDCESTATPKPPALSTSTLVYIVIASVLVFLFVATILVIIGVWKYRRSRQYAENSEDENTEYRRDVVGKSWMRFFDDGKFPYIPRGSRYSTQTYSNPKTERFY